MAVTSKVGSSLDTGGFGLSDISGLSFEEVERLSGGFEDGTASDSVSSGHSDLHTAHEFGGMGAQSDDTAIQEGDNFLFRRARALSMDLVVGNRPRGLSLEFAMLPTDMIDLDPMEASELSNMMDVENVFDNKKLRSFSVDSSCFDFKVSPAQQAKCKTVAGKVKRSQASASSNSSAAPGAVDAVDESVPVSRWTNNAIYAKMPKTGENKPVYFVFRGADSVTSYKPPAHSSMSAKNVKAELKAAALTAKNAAAAAAAAAAISSSSLSSVKSSSIKATSISSGTLASIVNGPLANAKAHRGVISSAAVAKAAVGQLSKLTPQKVAKSAIVPTMISKAKINAVNSAALKNAASVVAASVKTEHDPSKLVATAVASISSRDAKSPQLGTMTSVKTGTVSSRSSSSTQSYFVSSKATNVNGIMSASSKISGTSSLAAASSSVTSPLSAPYTTNHKPNHSAQTPSSSSALLKHQISHHKPSATGLASSLSQSSSNNSSLSNASISSILDSKLGINVTKTNNHKPPMPSSANLSSSLPSSLGNKPNMDRSRCIGGLTIEQRRQRIARFLEKRKRRVWKKKVKYGCRKKLADSRPRVKGRFVPRAVQNQVMAEQADATPPHKSMPTTASSHLHNNHTTKPGGVYKSSPVQQMYGSKPGARPMYNTGASYKKAPSSVQGYRTSAGGASNAGRIVSGQPYGSSMGAKPSAYSYTANKGYSVNGKSVVGSMASGTMIKSSAPGNKQPHHHMQNGRPMSSPIMSGNMQRKSYVTGGATGATSHGKAQQSAGSNVMMNQSQMHAGIRGMHQGQGSAKIGQGASSYTTNGSNNTTTNPPKSQPYAASGVRSSAPPPGNGPGKDMGSSMHKGQASRPSNGVGRPGVSNGASVPPRPHNGQVSRATNGQQLPPRGKAYNTPNNNGLHPTQRTPGTSHQQQRAARPGVPQQQPRATNPQRPPSTTSTMQKGGPVPSHGTGQRSGPSANGVRPPPHPRPAPASNNGGVYRPVGSVQRTPQVVNGRAPLPKTAVAPSAAGVIAKGAANTTK